MIPLEDSEHTNTTRHKELVDVTDELSKEGFNISIDDFGTAHANIYSLADLAVSEVKFDKKLIDNIAKKNNEKLTTILSVLITMCKKLGIKTIAEGVEDKEQSQILKNLGCDEIQGYYFSRPISALSEPVTLLRLALQCALPLRTSWLQNRMSLRSALCDLGTSCNLQHQQQCRQLNRLINLSY